MKYKTIQAAVAEAKRFIDAASNVKQSEYNGKKFDGIDSNKESGALRRASMDLTRVLAEMRKP